MIQRMPRKRDKPYGNTEWGDRLWRLRNRLELSHQALGVLCGGADRLEMRKLEAETKTLTIEAIELLAGGLKVGRDLMESYLRGRGATLEEVLAHRGKSIPQPETHRALLKRIAGRVGVPLDEVVSLAGEESGMDELTEIARRGVMGVVHVLGYPLETAIGIAREIFKERGDALQDAEEWFVAIKKKLPARAPSGTFPSSSKIKAARKISQ